MSSSKVIFYLKCIGGLNPDTFSLTMAAVLS